jgi:hypothetical protein
VNVVFHVPGAVSGPDWDGLRDGKFSRKKQLLMIQVAVAPELLSSTCPVNFVIESLHSANSLALAVFRKKGIEFLFAVAETIVHQIEEELQRRSGDG